MPEDLIQALAEWLARAVGHELGSHSFDVVLGVTLAAWIVVARLFAGLFGSDKGIIRCATAVLFPLALGMLGHGLVAVYALPHLEVEWAPSYLPWIGFGLPALVGIIAISRPALGLGMALTLSTLLIATGAGIGGYYGSQLFVDLMARGEKKVEERNAALGESMEAVPAE